MTAKRSFILATAGHVDHGKSSLVRALTGTDPDRLPAEKARGMTIELGFAHLNLDRFDIGVVDVPGHEDFVRNMVPGVNSIDVALFVVAADDGWMPQTEEHLQILSYLGATRAIIALNKVDRAHDFGKAVDAIRTRLTGTVFAEAPIVPTSATTGAGLEALRVTLSAMFEALAPRADFDSPRLAVDRAFSLHGIGTVVTGTLAGGTLHRDQTVIIQPEGVSSRIRALQTHGQQHSQIGPGTRVALNLPDVRPAGNKGGDNLAIVGRGDVVTVAGVGVVTRAADVLLQTSYRAGADSGVATRLRDGLQLMIHCGAATRRARLRLRNAEGLPTESWIARLNFDEPLHLLTGDRMVLRDASQRETLAGAIVLDPAPPRDKGRRDSLRAAQEKLLADRAREPPDAVLLLASAVQRDEFTDLSLLRQTITATDETIAAGIKAGGMIRFGGTLVLQARWKQFLADAGALVDRHHVQHPELKGLPLEDLRRWTTKQARTTSTAASGQQIFDALLNGITADFMVRQNIIYRPTHRPSLPPRLQEAGDALRQIMEAHPFDPPSRRDLCKTDLQQTALRFLIASGEFLELNRDIVISATAVERAIQLIRKALSSGKGATVSEIKCILRSSRRIVVPLLEFLDRRGITRRQDDLRCLANLAEH